MWRVDCSNQHIQVLLYQKVILVPVFVIIVMYPIAIRGFFEPYKAGWTNPARKQVSLACGQIREFYHFVAVVVEGDGFVYHGSGSYTARKTFLLGL